MSAFDVGEFFTKREIPLPDTATLVSVMGRQAYDQAASEPQLLETTYMRALQAFENEAGVWFGKHEGIAVVLISRDGVLYTGQPRITSIRLSVLENGEWVQLADSEYDWDEGFQSDRVRTALPDGTRVRVVYSCNYQPPAGVVARCHELAARLLLTPQDVRSGVTQMSETIGPFTEQVSYAAWATGGQAILSPEDKRYARRLKPGPWARTIPTREGVR